MKNLEIFKTMNFEEIDFYVFYVEYLSKKNMKIKKYQQASMELMAKK